MISVNNELKSRLIAGGVAGFLVVGTVLTGFHDITFLLALGAGVLGWREYSRMMGIQHKEVLNAAGYFFVVLMFTYSYRVEPLGLAWVWFTWLSGFFLLFLETNPWLRKWLSPNSPEQAELDVSAEWTSLIRFVVGLVYIYFLFGFVGPIVEKKHGEQILLLALSVVWIGDSAAFFIGKKYGKSKLWPALSPKKTVEGALGGIGGSVAAALVIWLLWRLFADRGNALDVGTCLLVAVLGGPLAQLGDFLESLMKRAAGRKDSGGIMPGHGGILDRADGLAFVMPLVYFLF